MTHDDSLSERKVSEIAPPPTPDGFEDPTVSDANELESRGRRRKPRLYCFHCNRPETHSNPYMGAWFYSYFIGLTFGLLHLFGPFRCTCCGRQRLIFKDWAHPKFHAIMARNRAASPSRRR